MLAIYPGSFDPPTKGHLDIIRRASRLFDEVVVIFLINEKKKPMFTPEERKDMLQSITRDLPNVRIECSREMLIEEVHRHNADAIIRGLRSTSDYQAELPVAEAFMQLFGAETVFLQSKAEHMYISSSMVREILHFNGDISKMVPEEIVCEIENKRV